MSAPRKGKDISALKARLAKRANPGGAPPAGVPQAPAPQQPMAPPQAQAPVPQQPQRPMTARPNPAPAPAARPNSEQSFSDLEATRPAAVEERRQINQAAQRAAAPARGGAMPSESQQAENPFAGGSEDFDPNAGLIGGDAGEYKPKSNFGLLGGGIAIGLVGGLALGWMANISMGTSKKVEVAQAKAGRMLKEIQKVSDSRKGLAMEWDDIKKKMASSPGEGAKKLREVMTTNFPKGFAREEQLFGWQLGNMGKSTVDSTFSLYRTAKSLKSNLNDLARFSQNEGKMLVNAPAPQAYAVLLRDGQAQLVQMVNAICGDLEAAKPCPPNARKKPTGAAVRLAPGGEVKNIPVEKLAILVPRGPFYSTTFAGDPKSSARMRLQTLVRRVDEDLKKMVSAEAATEKGFKRYQSDPKVNEDAEG